MKYCINNAIILIDSLKKEIQKCEKEKNKRKQQMQDYIFLVEKKTE